MKRPPDSVALSDKAVYVKRGTRWTIQTYPTAAAAEKQYRAFKRAAFVAACERLGDQITAHVTAAFAAEKAAVGIRPTRDGHHNL